MSGEGPLARIAAPISLVRRPKVLLRAASRMAFLWRILDHFEEPEEQQGVEEKGRTATRGQAMLVVAVDRMQSRDGPAIAKDDMAGHSLTGGQSSVVGVGCSRR